MTLFRDLHGIFVQPPNVSMMNSTKPLQQGCKAVEGLMLCPDVQGNKHNGRLSLLTTG